MKGGGGRKLSGGMRGELDHRLLTILWSLWIHTAIIASLPEQIQLGSSKYPILNIMRMSQWQYCTVFLPSFKFFVMVEIANTMCYMTPLKLWMWCELLTRMINIGEQVAEIYTKIHFVVTNKSSVHAMAIACTQFLSMSTKQQESEYQRHPHPINRRESKKVAAFL